MNLGLVRSSADLSSRWRSRFLPSRASLRPQHLRRGAQGETLACRFLRRNGYKILYRNFKGHSGGEIDVVCRDKDTLVFVEVKTRTRKNLAGLLQRSNDKSKNEFRGGDSTGCGCWINPIFATV